LAPPDFTKTLAGLHAATNDVLIEMVQHARVSEWAAGKDYSGAPDEVTVLWGELGKLNRDA
jgi:hypothetical protein